MHCSINANLHAFVRVLAFDATTFADLAKALPDADKSSGHRYRAPEAMLTFTHVQLMEEPESLIQSLSPYWSS